MAKLRVFREVTTDKVWKSFVAKMQQLNHSKTTACKEKCYMIEKKWCGKVMDVTSNLGVFLFQKQRRLQKILNKEITNKTVRKQ